MLRLQRNTEQSLEHQALLKQILRDEFLVKRPKEADQTHPWGSVSEANSGGKQHWQLSRNRGWDWWSQFWPGSQGTNSWRGKKGQISRRVVHGTPVYTRQKIPRINHWPWSNIASLFCLRCRRSGQREHSSDQSSYCPCPRTYEADSDKVPEGKGHLPALHIRACQNSTVEETGYSKVTFSHKKNSNLVSQRLRPSSGRGPDGWNLSVLSVRDQILKRRAEEAETHHPYF